MATSKVQPLLLAGAYKEALQSVIEAVRVELDGPKEEKTDTGFLALIIAISVAVLLVCIITGGKDSYGHQNIITFNFLLIW